MCAGLLFLINSAALRTLVGTLFNLIALLAVDEDWFEDDSLVCGFGGLNGELSLSVQGEGSGFKGEIIDADVESEGTWAELMEARELPTIGILRDSPKGFKNSLGRRCLWGLQFQDVGNGSEGDF
jgi:hypothetical protein